MKWISNLAKMLRVSILLGVLTTINCVSLIGLLYPKLKKGKTKKDDSNKRMSTVALSSNNDMINDILVPSGTFLPIGNIILVCVIEMNTPSDFWIRVGFEKTDMEYLREELTDYYNKEENRIFHYLEKVMPGQLVAVNRDDEWHRGKVIAPYKENQYEILFVDEGRINIISKDDISELRTDIFNVGFQIVKCSLADTKWRENEIEWTSDPCRKFCDMIDMSNHLVLVKIKGIKHEIWLRPRTPIVYVDLYALHGSTHINVGETLKRLELAQSERDVYLTKKSGLLRSKQEYLRLINLSSLSKSLNISDESDF